MQQNLQWYPTIIKTDNIKIMYIICQLIHFPEG